MTYQGIILRQTKALNNRRMILLFSDKYGKISAGTSINEKGKGKSALALRPFTYSRFEIVKNKSYLNIRDAETIKSYYHIGDDLNKFANASYIVEFTERLLPEEIPAPKFFALLTDYLDIMETRKKAFKTVTIAYMVKSIQYTGVAPQTDKCLKCGENNKAIFFDIENAGFICQNCSENSTENSSQNADFNGTEKLLYKVNFDIVNILNFLMENPLKRVENLELNEDATKELWRIINKYTAYHLDIGNIKSESLLDI